MKLRLILDHSVGFRYDEDDYGGKFAMALEGPFDRTPTLNEGLRLGGGFTATVRSVIWQEDGTAEIGLVVDPETSAEMPSRRGLIASGWVDMEDQDST